MKSLKTFVTRVASVMLLGLSIVGISQLAGYSDPVRAYTSIYDCSWAATDSSNVLLANVRGAGSESKASGYAGFSGPGWTAGGAITAISSVIDADGEHITVSANITLSHIINHRRADFIPAVATFTGLVSVDGSQSEGVAIVDASGNVLTQTPMLPLVRGSLNISH